MKLSAFLGIFLTAASTQAWPIVFFNSPECKGHPAFVLEKEPSTEKCGFFDRCVTSYRGGTHDDVQKLLLYYEAEICLQDGAHRFFGNHTVTDKTKSGDKCVSFGNSTSTPRAFAFIEEFLPVPTKNSSVQTSFVAQTQREGAMDWYAFEE
ncbi:hypothetical protein M422DRAFT_274512 [Sphaerobolus stellatus SS14]|uniref:Uncharacterized protein n=1 Tax=Sphaerobolus stellatus (strain SS14) TaxID=990650 RepID=A0A0C9UGU6_SPHS4|nr:hypothetical protein M422DRAFT_274512 [Sphaerobolus stellatus SS14]